jgi:hypothetical protein
MVRVTVIVVLSVRVAGVAMVVAMADRILTVPIVHPPGVP